MTIDFEGRENQYKLYQTIIGSAQGLLPYKHIRSGGAIRGAKSFTNVLGLLTLTKQYQESKWACIRKDLTVLEATTIETVKKILNNSDGWQWNRSRSNYHIQHRKSGGRIFFVGANESRDKDFTDTLGLEINGAFFDQLEDVSEEYYNAVLQRLGSHHIENEPQPITLETFNPHPGWIKKKIYLPYKEGKMPDNCIYYQLSPVNEPSNTQSQWEIWNSMPPDVKARMIEGDWNSFDNKNPYFYAYDENRMLSPEPLQVLPSYPVLCWFDFNIDPATCVISQVSRGAFIRIYKSFKVPNCPLEQLCNQILSSYQNVVFRVTGDPSGNNRNQGYNSANETMYSIIRRVMRLSHNQVDKCPISYTGPDADRERRIFLNAILQRHPHIQFDKDGTEELRSDLRIATTEEGKDKMYKTSGNTEYGMHLADCFVYGIITYLNDYIKN